MPELPEIEITRQKLIKAKLIGARISGFWSDWPRSLRIAKSKRQIDRDIGGRTILGLRRVGKVLFFDLSGLPAKVLAWHFKMSGRLEVAGRNDAISEMGTLGEKGEKGTTGEKREMGGMGKGGIHNKVFLSDGRVIAFRDPRKFGIVWYGAPEELAKDSYIGSLGPDLSAVKFSEFKKQLAGRSGAIKPILLDQKVISGVGNIIADESLWRARVHPKKSVYKFHDREIFKLFRSLKFVMERILSSGGSTMRDWSHPDGEAGGYERLRWVYGRKGEPCPRCKYIIRRIVVGGRGTSFCEKCQKT